MSLEQMKVPELKALAKKLGIEGSDGMKKADLIDAISKMPALNAEDLHPPTQVGVESSPEKSDYASHPKFAKFNSSQGAE